MVWALDLDDFKNRCGCGKYPLLSAINHELRGYPQDSDDCTQSLWILQMCQAETKTKTKNRTQLQKQFSIFQGRIMFRFSKHIQWKFITFKSIIYHIIRLLYIKQCFQIADHSQFGCVVVQRHNPVWCYFIILTNLVMATIYFKATTTLFSVIYIIYYKKIFYLSSIFTLQLQVLPYSSVLFISILNALLNLKFHCEQRLR